MTPSSAAIRLFRPNATTVHQFVESQSGLPFSYSPVGCTSHSTGAGPAPAPGYVLDHNRSLLGFGEETFERAAAVLCSWGMFDIGWVELHRGISASDSGERTTAVSQSTEASLKTLARDLSITTAATLPAVGTTVCVLAKVFGLSFAGLWIMNACRVQRHIDTPPTDTEPRRFGFAYGTLPGHVERGEERFLIEHSPTDNSVTYDLLAISQPAHWMAKLGQPIARTYQKQFARDSLQTMQRLVLGDSKNTGDYSARASSG